VGQVKQHESALDELEGSVGTPFLHTNAAVVNAKATIAARTGVTALTPTLGALMDDDGVRFRVWAPDSHRVDVVFDRFGATVTRALEPEAGRTFSGWVPGIEEGTNYRFRLDGTRALPDPASRWQPDGVNGPSQVVDAGRFAWSDDHWKGVTLRDLVMYELHVGTFTDTGTFAGVQTRLEYLQHLGITAIEIMPIAEFPGRRNWGYDGVFLFAPSHHYGHPDDLRRLVNAAHQCGIAVILDVVYNHVGPDGAVWSSYTPRYFTDRHRTPWGAAVNLDGDDARAVRDFFIQNALHWVHEYHVDGLRLDATHALHDESHTPFLAELSAAVHDAAPGRSVLVIAEDDRRMLKVVEPSACGGFGLDAMWVDDFHHEMRRLTAGDHEGYFAKYSGTTEGVAAALARGGRLDRDASDLQPFVICLQNHDQVGNRALGDRVHHGIEHAVYRAASAVLFTAPETPLLFMGQEWGASSPFCFFTDHNEELGAAITNGRRQEFAAFSAFQNPRMRERIPDPQADATFIASRLRWSELGADTHQQLFRLYQALLAIRRTYAAFQFSDVNDVTACALDEDSLALVRHPEGVDSILVVARLAGAGSVDVPLPSPVQKRCWSTILTTEDRAFTASPRPVRVRTTPESMRVTFPGPAAVVLRGR
jgi:maltooligosyltrehalose trehalohydrolase